MDFNFNPAMWFVCKLCGQTFRNTDTLKEHKIRSHFGDCLNIKCIVFEERFLDHDPSPVFNNNVDSQSSTSTSPATSTSVPVPHPTLAIRKQIQRKPSQQIKSRILTTIVDTAQLPKRSKFSETVTNTSTNNARIINIDELHRHRNRNRQLFPSLRATNSISSGNDNCDNRFVKQEIELENSSNNSDVNMSPHSDAGTDADADSDADADAVEISTSKSPPSQPEFSRFQKRKQSFETIVSPIRSIKSESESEQAEADTLPLIQIRNFEFESNFNSDSETGETATDNEMEEAARNTLAGARAPETETENHHDTKFVDYEYEILPTSFLQQSMTIPLNFEQELEQEQPKRQQTNLPSLRIQEVLLQHQRQLQQNEEQRVHYERERARAIQNNPDKLLKPYMCEICFYFFREKSYLKQHMKTHSDNRPFKCTLCPATFKTKHSMQSHQIVHGMVTQYTCTFCFKSFHSQGALEDHERTHTGQRPFKCSVASCGGSFSSKSALNMHTKSKHTEELGLQQFVCPTCGRTFGLKSYLTVHIQVQHSKDKPFKCSNYGCSQAFKLKWKLTKHLKECEYSNYPNQNNQWKAAGMLVSNQQRNHVS